MRISDLSKESSGERCRLRAKVEYEDSDKGIYDVWFEVPREAGASITPSYAPFLLGAYTAANHHRERRIAVEGALCPYLVENLTCASRLARWSRGLSDEVARIEWSGSLSELDLQPQREWSCLLSGGVDSLSMLARNVSLNSTYSTRRYRRAFFVYGLDLGNPNKSDAYDKFLGYDKALREAIAQHGVELIPVKTNIRNIETNAYFFEHDQFGGILAGVAYLFLGRVERASLALDMDFRYQIHHGLNSRNAALMSSEHMTVVGEMENYSRLDKVKLLASFPRLLRVLRVCHKDQHAPDGYMNCGMCEKCTRTRLELIAAGAHLGDIFPGDEIEMRALHRLRISDAYAYDFWHELLDHVKASGRTSWEKPIRRALRSYRVRKLASDVSDVVTRHAHGFVSSPSR